uniref:DUF3778 domain-containing protein n=1 Tax=Oryza barthii TaxID=65489 RepID=A0A0D3H7T5_9ORYZ
MAAVMVSGGGAERFEGLLMNQWMETSFGAAAGYKQCEGNDNLGALSGIASCGSVRSSRSLGALCSGVALCGGVDGHETFVVASSYCLHLTVKISHVSIQGLPFELSTSCSSDLMGDFLRSNGRLRGIIVLSPVMPPPKSMAQQLTSNLCHFCGNSRRSFTVCQTVSISMEAQVFSRHGFAAELCRSDSPLLFSIYWKFASLDCLVSSLLEMVAYFTLYPFVMYGLYAMTLSCKI